MNYNNVPCSINDFSTGLLAGLASIGVTQLSVQGLDKRVEKAFRAWEADAEKAGLRLRFIIVTDDKHGDCRTLRDGIAKAVSRGLGFFDEDNLNISMSPHHAAMFLEGVPGDYRLWEKLANSVMKTR